MKNFQYLFLFIFMLFNPLVYADSLMDNLVFTNIEDNDLTNIQRLIKNGSVDINNIFTEEGDTPLQYAAFLDKIDSVKLLIEANADINAVNSKGYTALHFAAQQGATKIIEYLVSKGADLHIKNKDGVFPVHLAAMFGQMDSLEKLISYEKDVDIMAVFGITPLQIAAQNGHNNIVQFLLLKGADPNQLAEDSHGTSLHFAVHGSQPDTVKLLLDHGAQVNKTNDTGDSPFIWNGYIGNIQTAQILLAAGANTSIKTKRFEYQAIHTASIRGKTELIKYFLENKIYTGNELSAVGALPLHYSALYGRLDTVQLLIPVTKDINKQDIYGKTPLYYAVENNQPDIVKILLSAHADVNITDKSGQSALDIARHLKLVEILNILQEK